MTRVLKDNLVINTVCKNKIEAMIEFMVSKMELVLAAPEVKIIREGDNLESKFHIF